MIMTRGEVVYVYDKGFRLAIVVKPQNGTDVALLRDENNVLLVVHTSRIRPCECGWMQRPFRVSYKCKRCNRKTPHRLNARIKMSNKKGRKPYQGKCMVCHHITKPIYCSFTELKELQAAADTLVLLSRTRV